MMMLDADALCMPHVSFPFFSQSHYLRQFEGPESHPFTSHPNPIHFLSCHFTTRKQLKKEARGAVDYLYFMHLNYSGCVMCAGRLPRKRAAEAPPRRYLPASPLPYTSQYSQTLRLRSSGCYGMGQMWLYDRVFLVALYHNYQKSNQTSWSSFKKTSNIVPGGRAHSV